MIRVTRVLGTHFDGARRRLRLVRVEMVTPAREMFFSVALAARAAGWRRGYREVRATLLGVEIHYRETSWSSFAVAT